MLKRMNKRVTKTLKSELMNEYWFTYKEVTDFLKTNMK